MSKAKNEVTTRNDRKVLSVAVVSPDGDDSPDDLAFYQLWQPTSVPTSKDVIESKRVAKVIRPVPTRCWSNARNVILQLDAFKEASYCEGWVGHPLGLLFEHGWVVKGDTIIDPTQPDLDLIYFCGLEFRGRSGIAEFLATPQGRRYGSQPFFHAFGWAGQTSPSFRRCLEEATAWSQLMRQRSKKGMQQEG